MKIQAIYNLFNQSNGISTDTRNINDSSIFFALKGGNFNGNKFAKLAIDLGASYAIIDEKEYHINDKTILVKDVLATLQELASLHRRTLKTPIIALTGSNGKTTTKELIKAVLDKKYTTTATIGNLNNHIGVPLTLLSFSKNTEIGIVEMGANHQKEIEFLANLTEPNYGYITNFGKAHLEGFGGIEGVIKGKTELYRYLIEHNKKAFINSLDPIQTSYKDKLETILFGNENSINSIDPFLSINYNNTKIQSNLIGEYNITNINAAIAIGEHFNVQTNDIKSALENYTPKNNRSQIIEKNSSKIILDAYNANPTSMKAALSNFNKLNAQKKILILGDMFELGKTATLEHQSILDYAEELHFDEIHIIGENFNKTHSNISNRYTNFENFKSIFHPTPATYLIKGSRGMALERVLELFD